MHSKHVVHSAGEEIAVVVVHLARLAWLEAASPPRGGRSASYILTPIMDVVKKKRMEEECRILVVEEEVEE